MVPEGAMQDFIEAKQIAVLPSYDAYNPTMTSMEQWRKACSSGLHNLAVTKSSLAGLMTIQQEGVSCIYDT